GDYTTKSGTLTFASGSSTPQTFTVTVNSDSLFEGDETFNLTLSNPTNGATLGAQSTAVISIIDHDPLPRLSIRDLYLNEGDSGTKNAVFSVNLSPTSDRTVTV